jgi:MoxR-like ATPase
MFQDISDVRERLGQQQYIASEEIGTVVYLAQSLCKPILAEGPAGVGKTELAKVWAGALGQRLVRLQCYEGLDESKALYEWEYAKQMLYTQLLRDTLHDFLGDAGSLAEAAGRLSQEEDVFFSENFLLPRPLLTALTSEQPVVLLIDEIDRADEEFESFLLEVLSDFQITIPEIGAFVAPQPPVVVVTSNRTRQVHDALKRRCVYHWIQYPDFETEYRIVSLKAPEVGEELRRQIVAAVQTLRGQELFKPPGVAETLDWAQALHLMDCHHLDEATINDTLGVLLKYQDDVEEVSGEIVRQMASSAGG